MFTKYVATKDLFQALIRAKRSFKTEEPEELVEPLPIDIDAPCDERPSITYGDVYDD